MLSEFEKVLNISDTYTFVRFSFKLDKQYAKMRIRFGFAPHVLEDEAENLRLIRQCYAKYAPYLTDIADKDKGKKLCNHISLTLDTPAGCAGTAHRGQCSQEYEFYDGFASPGFMPFSLVPGEYFITMAINSIVIDGTKLSITVGALS